jgi:cytoskeletal protein RodZ
MTKSGFGEHLKRERELRGVSLDEICAATRIGTRFLEALETEDWERLPGGVFNRGFVRAVARYLGLDEEGTVAEYVMSVNQGTAPPATTSHIEPRQMPKLESRRPRPIVLVVILLLAGGGGMLGWRLYVRSLHSRSPQTPVSLPASLPPSLPSPESSAAFPPATVPPSSGLSSGGGTTAVPATDRLVLKIEAGKATGATVTADGQVVFGGTFIAGQSRTFQAESEFEVAAEDAGALLLQLNNQTLAPIGPPGQSGKVTLTRRNLKPSAGGDD